MNIVTSAEAVCAVKRVSPVRIAVAYIGVDWRDYVDKDVLTEIIVSPTIGSNPVAISQLVGALGWDRVHFLDSLHAKLYIGNGIAAFGSFNLTKNGLSGACLEELGAVTEDSGHLEKLTAEFERLRKLAIQSYPSIEDKKSRLSALELLWRRGISKGIIASPEATVSILDYEPVSGSNLSVVWWCDVDVTRDESVLAASDKSLVGSGFDDCVANWTTSLNDDNLEEGVWILLWRMRKDGMPDQRDRPHWLYVHQAIRNAIIDDGYRKIVIQRKDMKLPLPPFELSPMTQKAIKAVLSREDFAIFREQEDKYWSANSCRNDIGRFVAAVKEECKRLSREAC